MLGRDGNSGQPVGAEADAGLLDRGPPRTGAQSPRVLAPDPGRSAEAPEPRARRRRKRPAHDALRLLKKLIKRGSGVALFYFFPRTLLALLACGLYDVSRNTGQGWPLWRQYFLGNGLLTWVLSPLNVVLDLLSLPHVNRGVYRLEDLPQGHREEIERVISAARGADLADVVSARLGDADRAMLFFKWYGEDLPASIVVPGFQTDFRFVRTIGISVFKQDEATTRHFGPLRATLRVLCNLDRSPGPEARIEVGQTVHRWRDDPLFIFDDTLRHQSFNDGAGRRACLFVDVLRPTPWRAVMSAVADLARYLMRWRKGTFYHQWTMLR